MTESDVLAEIATDRPMLIREDETRKFGERIAPLGVDVHHVASLPEASAVIRGLAAELVVDSILVSSELLAAYPALAETLTHGGTRVEVAAGPDESRDAPLGLALARRTLLETGSLLMSERSLADRSVALLSLTCVVITPTEGMMQRLEDTAGWLRSEALRPGGAYSTFVTGPSRTADIEMSLTVGVQGPARMIVIFVDEMPLPMAEA
ncbi:hypothetical protein BH23CHL5_BH23CHL5_04300 [soil metagenome]